MLLYNSKRRKQFGREWYFQNLELKSPSQKYCLKKKKKSLHKALIGKRQLVLFAQIDKYDRRIVGRKLDSIRRPLRRFDSPVATLIQYRLPFLNKVKCSNSFPVGYKNGRIIVVYRSSNFGHQFERSRLSACNDSSPENDRYMSSSNEKRKI